MVLDTAYALEVISGPATEPLSLDEAKAWLRVTHTREDALIAGLIGAARERAELETERALITQTLRLTLDSFPAWYGQMGQTDADLIDLPRSPVQSIASVQYVDGDGATQTLSAASYQLDSRREPARLIPAYAAVWPTTRDVLNAVTITYIAGYGSSGDSVPESIKLAIKLMLAHWYEHREEVAATAGGMALSPIPLGAKALLWGNRLGGYP